MSEALRPKTPVYIFDSSAFIALHQHSLKVIELHQSIWDELANMMSDGRIVSHVYVYEEIVSESTKKPDFITNLDLSSHTRYTLFGRLASVCVRVGGGRPVLGHD